jgi:3-hydroxyacyl-[acyl-carrier-protein] dehydratase
MLDIEQIKACLPHRFPMLLVDRILEIEPGKRAVGIKNVTINEDFFNGHFPAQAIMPGVLIIEAMAQVGGVLMLSAPGLRDLIPVIARIDNVRLRRPVVPGDTLTTEVTVLYYRNRVGKVTLVGKVDGEIVAEAEMHFKLNDPRPTADVTVAGNVEGK